MMLGAWEVEVVRCYYMTSAGGAVQEGHSNEMESVGVVVALGLNGRCERVVAEHGKVLLQFLAGEVEVVEGLQECQGRRSCVLAVEEDRSYVLKEVVGLSSALVEVVVDFDCWSLQSLSEGELEEVDPGLWWIQLDFLKPGLARICLRLLMAAGHGNETAKGLEVMGLAGAVFLLLSLLLC